MLRVCFVFHILFSISQSKLIRCGLRIQWMVWHTFHCFWQFFFDGVLMVVGESIFNSMYKHVEKHEGVIEGTHFSIYVQVSQELYCFIFHFAIWENHVEILGRILAQYKRNPLDLLLETLLKFFKNIFSFLLRKNLWFRNFRSICLSSVPFPFFLIKKHGRVLKVKWMNFLKIKNSFSGVNCVTCNN